MRVSKDDPLMANETQCQLFLGLDVLNDIFNSTLASKSIIGQSYTFTIGRNRKRDSQVIMKITFSPHTEEKNELQNNF